MLEAIGRCLWGCCGEAEESDFNEESYIGTFNGRLVYQSTEGVQRASVDETDWFGYVENVKKSGPRCFSENFEL